MIKILHNNSCSKSRGILEYLDENGVAFEIIDIINQPLSEMELRTVLKKLHCPVKDLVRTNEKLYKEQFGDKNLGDDDLIQMLLQNPELIQRPIIIKGSVAMIGRPIENVKFFLEK
ncbi:arsenate reductase (glutaredoxin) [Kaistella flava (ex Peng et al. 2021)]|uniref:Arsenate reductase (Glutaredoxin) n=1 Tax=Kaistella flava (ex Peng et al. 2021) TaxID=2038776 RepID=A0A7M2Y4S9_9FLAO|nr:ArsC/Spx/MgsR family protein [Kaistella flava (ex Peng et al. 2021)]QOW09248.1 arsenate reductase (glutaredoxin) [Kaistella flava (ex Peng et al. 2021)]